MAVPACGAAAETKAKREGEGGDKSERLGFHPQFSFLSRNTTEREAARDAFEPLCQGRQSPCTCSSPPPAPPKGRRMGNTLPLVSSSEFPFFKFKLTPSVDEVEAEEAREIEEARQARERREEQAQASGSAAGSDTTSG